MRGYSFWLGIWGVCCVVVMIVLAVHCSGASFTQNVFLTGNGHYVDRTYYGASAAWLCAYTNDGMTSYVQDAGRGDGRTFWFIVQSGNVPANATVTSVRVACLVLGQVQNPSWVALGVWRYGPEYWSGLKDCANSSFTWYTASWSVNPYTGAPWSYSDMNSGTEVGIVIQNPNVCTQVYATIYYTVPDSVPGVSQAQGEQMISVAGSVYQWLNMGTDVKCIMRWLEGVCIVGSGCLLFSGLGGIVHV